MAEILFSKQMQDSIREVKKNGWRVGFFSDGRPGGLVLRFGEASITADGKLPNWRNCKLGIYKVSLLGRRR